MKRKNSTPQKPLKKSKITNFEHSIIPLMLNCFTQEEIFNNLFSISKSWDKKVSDSIKEINFSACDFKTVLKTIQRF
jgi:hypothetical protein